MNALLDQAVQRAMKMAFSISELPGVPTPDWCTQAARCIAGSHSSAAASVQIGRRQGELLAVEASGVVASAMGVQESVLRESLGGPVLRVPTGLSDVPTVFRRGEELALAQLGNVWFRLPIGGLITSGVQVGAREMVLGVALPAGAASQDFANCQTLLRAAVPMIADRAKRALSTSPEGHCAWLTTKEHEILDILTQGWSVKEIAEQLGRSPHTVHDHVKSIHRKLGANSRGELVARAFGHLGVGPGASVFESKPRRSAASA